MAAGARGMLAFWMGGAGSSSTQASGVRSMLAPWMGGAAAAAPSTSGGQRSLLAPWMGGAGASAPATSGGLRSLLAFWMGGASLAPGTETPPATSGGGALVRYLRDAAEASRRETRRQLEEEKRNALLAAAERQSKLVDAGRVSVKQAEHAISAPLAAVREALDALAAEDRRAAIPQRPVAAIERQLVDEEGQSAPKALTAEDAAADRKRRMNRLRAAILVSLLMLK